jgi:hypothetical protein
MRKLLNRPWFVALLALAALFVVSRAVFSGAKVRGTAGPDPEPTTDSAPADAETAPRLSVLEALKALGIPATVRDPFALPPKPAEVVADLPGNTVVEVVDKLRLSAVWVQGTAVFLLLNGQICQPGDTVERFTVESADVDGVWVRHASGRSFLAVGRELAVQSTAPGPAAPLSQ